MIARCEQNGSVCVGGKFVDLFEIDNGHFYGYSTHGQHCHHTKKLNDDKNAEMDGRQFS